jgi:hypothetical protein
MIVFPDELLVNAKIETTIFREQNDAFGIAALSEADEDATYILRVYQLIWEDEERSFTPIQELEAFRFLNRKELDDSLVRLSDMSGLKMLMILNPLPGVH